MAIRAIVPYLYTIMSIRNTKKSLYHIWHVDAEDSPLGMMMRKTTVEGAHVTHSHSVLLSSKVFFSKQDPTPPSYAMVTQGRSSPSKCSWGDPVFRIPKIEVNPPTPKKKGDPLPMGRYIPPMAPLEVHLPQPTQTGTLSPIPMIIDLTNEPSTTSGGTSLAHHQSVQLESQMQVKMGGGTLTLRCKLGGRITSGAHDEKRKESRWLGPVVANYQQSKEA
jgi:hypothetical protein